MKTIKNEAMKIKLIDRILLIGLMPQKGKFEDLVISEDIINKIKIKQDEIVKFEIKSQGEQTTWNNEGVISEFNVDFTSLEVDLIKKQLTILNENNELTKDFLPIYKLFNT